VLTNLGILAACVPGAELISSPEPRTVLARLGSYNASARVADRDDKGRTLRLIAAARAATGPSAAASLTLTLRPRPDGAVSLELDGDIDLIDTAIKSIPVATIRAFIVSLRARLEQPVAAAPGKTPATANLAVPSLATTGVMPAYKPPPTRPPTPARSSTPIANPTVAPPPPAEAPPAEPSDPASALDAVRDWLTTRREKRDG
jgi:hypothetical protein